jgi:SOS-response transcriptional repressor LexA
MLRIIHKTPNPYGLPTRFHPTALQFLIYEFCVEFFLENDQLPSLKVIAEKFGYTSRNGAKNHIDALIRKGFLERNSLGYPMFPRKHPTTPNR